MYIVTRCLLLLSFIGLISCSEAPKQPIKLGFNAWPGYEFLYLAEQKGFFEQVGANIELVQLSSLSDGQRAYVSGRIDGIASTLVEVVQATQLSDRPLKVVLMADYSNGGDVIVANKMIAGMPDLRGKRVGVELGALGLVFLQKALAKYEMTVDDVEAVNVEQSEGEHALLSGDIAAFVSYPPASLKILRGDNVHQIFSSAEIPYEIIDVVSVDAAKLEDDAEFVGKLHKVWQMALEYAAKNPEESNALMAERQGVSATEFKESLSGVEPISLHEQAEFLSANGRLQNSLHEVCEILISMEALELPCSTLPSMVYTLE
ncbi:MAG: ABC transporter substrate-binding protein [Agarilytica sp.]